MLAASIIILVILVAILIVKLRMIKELNNKILQCPYTYKSYGPRTSKMFCIAIKGAYYRSIKVSHYCDAYLVLEPCEQDENAVAVYSANDVHLGYLPKNHKFKKRMVEYLKEVKRVDGYAVLEMNPDNPFEPFNNFKTRLPKDFMK